MSGKLFLILFFFFFTLSSSFLENCSLTSAGSRPHSMNKPFKPEYSNIAWSYDMEHFAAWCEGRTGFPIVDAAMRQLRGTGWMHNRCRMIVASFLAKDFLIDWRMGERYFMENLVDGDFASNNGGWGFAASVGVDPQRKLFLPSISFMFSKSSC